MHNYVLVRRGDKTESRHRIHAALVDQNGRLSARIGDPDFMTFFRSSAKPFQTLALFRSGAIDHFSFSDQDIALFTASHNGEKIHIDGVRKILRKIGLDKTFLKCGFHPPNYQKALEKFYASHSDPSPIYNNCSGKHAGMLAACVLHNYDLATYLNPDHPHQRLIKQIVSEFSEIPTDKKETATDGCGVPAFYLSLRQMAKMNAGFARSKATGVQRIRRALANFPEHMAGTARFDTIFNKLFTGRVITKVGAEAIQSFIFFEPEPMGLVVKCEDGQFRASESASVEILRQLNLIPATEAEQLHEFWQPVLKNHAGKMVGEILPRLSMD